MNGGPSGVTSGRSTTIIARVVTYSLVAGLLVLGALDQELWPLSSFRLFSTMRTGQDVRWEVSAVGVDGHESLVPLRSPHSSLRGAHHVLPTLRGQTTAGRRRALTPYLDAAGIDAADIQAVRVYRVVRRTPTDGHPPGPLVSRRLSFAVPW